MFNTFELTASLTLDSKQYNEGMKEAQEQAKETNASIQSQVMKLAYTYRQQGMSQSEAMKKANAEIRGSQEKTVQESHKNAKSFFHPWKKGSGELSSWMIAKAQLMADGVKMSIKAVAQLAKASISAYAQTEQLIGGVDTLFKDSSKKVQEYAAVAYKTAGMSANKYMETVTGFSASLLQSLGGDTDKAAEISNMALIDMSDNANKMGTSVESIRYAYMGFAKQNYTMLKSLAA